MSLSYRTLWLSDIHLGTRASRAEDLLNFGAAAYSVLAALAESHDGSLQILQWQSDEVVTTMLPAAPPLAA